MAQAQRGAGLHATATGGKQPPRGQPVITITATRLEWDDRHRPAFDDAAPGFSINEPSSKFPAITSGRYARSISCSRCTAIDARGSNPSALFWTLVRLDRCWTKCLRISSRFTRVGTTSSATTSIPSVRPSCYASVQPVYPIAFVTPLTIISSTSTATSLPK